MLTHKTVLPAFALLLVLAGTVPGYAQQARTRVAEGTLVGKAVGPVTAYLGVPFAAPPTSELRWKPPQPAAKWSGERSATQFAASCQQALTPDGFGPWSKEYVVNGAVSEDCLYLNVWTPARNPAAKLPVLFWIYGGGFNSGSGSVPIYDGAALAAKGIVVVNVNYRVGLYGFLAHPELSAESPARASGNYGLLDQVAALRWVKANIAGFGGDPARVTIAGQSAGAASVHLLIASPLASGLFAQAIAQSGSGMGLPVQDHTMAEAAGRNFSAAGGESLTLAKLRKLTPAQLDERVGRITATGTTPGVPSLRFGTSIDGLFLPAGASATRNLNDTPILTGMTANEGTGIFPDYGKATPASLAEQFTKAYGPLASQFTALYPAGNNTDALTAFDAHARDRGLASMYFWAEARLQSSRQPIYAYLWTHVEPGPDAGRYKAFHSSEIPYVFDVLDTAQRPFTDVDRRLAAQLSGYWVNFVVSGDPNGNNLPEWPRFNGADKQVLELGDHIHARPLLESSQISLFEQVTKNGGQLGLF